MYNFLFVLKIKFYCNKLYIKEVKYMVNFDAIFGTMKFKDQVERKKFEVMFDIYIKDLPDNFYKNQFELAKETSTDYNDWVKFLTHPSFENWKSEQIAIIATTQTDKALAGGEDLQDKNALSLLKARQDILKNENKTDKATIIVLPDSLFFE